MRRMPSQGDSATRMHTGGFSCHCIVVDGLLRRLNKESYYTQGDADDVLILVKGTHLETLLGLTRSTLRIVELSCDSSEPSFYPEKTSLMIFTKNHDIAKAEAPVFCGGMLIFSDFRLTWGLRPNTVWSINFFCIPSRV